MTVTGWAVLHCLIDYFCKHKFEVVEYTDYIDHDCGSQRN